MVRLGDWEWNPDTLELRIGARVTTLEPRVGRLFDYLIEHQGELLSHDRLVEAVWERRVLSNEAVRHAVFSLRQALATQGAGECIRTVHKKGYIATFPQPQSAEPARSGGRSTAPPAGTPAPEAVPADPLPAAGAATPERHGRLPGWLLALGGIVVTALFVTWLLQPRPSGVGDPPATGTPDPVTLPATIAVLPFTNASDQDTGQFLADGLTDELLATLERNDELRVTARNSAFQFRDRQTDARELGQRLGVRYLLQGSVSNSEGDLQVRPRLVDTRSGAELWAASYARASPDWFALQQEVAAAVTGAVQSRLHGDTQAASPIRRVDNEEAQKELLRARRLLLTRSVADAEQAIEHLQRALTLDPNFALAYARLADAILIQAESTTGIKAARPVVAPLLDRALALDPDLGEAYALRSRLTDDPAAAERDLRRGLELNPSYARGYEMLANLQLQSPQQMDLAIDAIDAAIALDPLSPGNFHTKAVYMMWRGNYPEVMKLDGRALELNPEFRVALTQLGFISGVEGHFADAVYYGERAVALDPRAVPLRETLIQAYLAVRDLDSARAVNDPPTSFGRLALLEPGLTLAQAAEGVYEGSYGPVAEIAPELLSEFLLRQALADKDYARALALLSGLLPFADGLPPTTIGWRLGGYANVVQLLDANGDRAAASRLQEQMEALMVTLEARLPRHALIHNQVRAVLLAHAGRQEDACARLESAYTPAPRLFWWVILGNPAFDGMRDAPCLRSLQARIEAHVTAEREAIEAMRRAGRIPDRTGTRRKREEGTPS